jgi:hypothetical protein
MLQAFIDDSGSEPTDPIFVLGGFVSTTDAWTEFTDEWGASLSKDIPIRYFKSTEANGARGEFAIRRGWERALIDARVEELSAIAQKHALFRVAAMMRWSDYNCFLKDIGDNLKIPFNRFLSSPYFLCLASIKIRVQKFCVFHGLDPICYYTLDEQGATGEFSALLFQHVADPGLRELLGGVPSFRDDKEILPLQAADLYAYQRHDWAVSGGKPRYENARRMLEVVPSIETTLDYRYLADLRATLLSSVVSAPQFLRAP